MSGLTNRLRPKQQVPHPAGCGTCCSVVFPARMVFPVGNG
ncbi:hypothetical protein ART_3647 [Arthrobacter sp. PAMC 25486]|nr:hypothetical protein ART_3647 [Arthrobacter sp. PAMC 25486]